jgi:hypothetical protein
LTGAFTVDASGDATLVISYMGYKTQEIKVANQKTIKIILQEDAEIFGRSCCCGIWRNAQKATLPVLLVLLSLIC